MTTETEQVGFKVGAKFYPFVSIEQWTRGDSVLVHRLTHLGDELFDGNHRYELQSGFIAVAISHAEPGVTHDRIIRRVYDLGVDDVEEIGFPDDDEDEDADVSPPEEGVSTPSNSSHESGAAPSEEST